MGWVGCSLHISPPGTRRPFCRSWAAMMPRWMILPCIAGFFRMSPRRWDVTKLRWANRIIGERFARSRPNWPKSSLLLSAEIVVSPRSLGNYAEYQTAP
jgi:hypothetical protein